MSKLRVNDVLGEDGVSAVGFSKGAVVTGVCTATTFSGNLTGSSSGLTGTPNITINNLTGVAATFTGAVAIGGTLTYEDVVNVDSVGIITARTGGKVTAGDYIIAECYKKLDPDTYTDVWGDRWLQRYVTCLFKIQWGSNLTKFVGMQLPGGVQFNGEQILQQGLDEKQRLEEEMISSYSLPVHDMTG